MSRTAASSLEIAQGLALPLEGVTQTFAILAKRGAGKTHTAVVLAEELLEAGQQVLVLDPLDVWWGLRSSRDGKGAGYPITVLGGEHADLPIQATDGAQLADFAVRERASIILSLRHFSMGDQRRLATDFCERLYRQKGQDEYRQPLHLIIDEADEFVPQRIMSGQERMFGSIDRLIRRGRASGIGVTLISQRAAVVNKDVLTQIEVLIALRTISPQDRKALEAWIEAHDAHGQAKAFMASLAALEIGEAWVWCPGWLDLFKRVKIRNRRTFDSSATPKVGQKAAVPKQIAAVDLEQLRKKLAATIERAKEEDPRELQARIRSLEAELRKAPKPAAVDPQALDRAREKGRLDADIHRSQDAETVLGELNRAIKVLEQSAERVRGLIVRDVQLVSPPDLVMQPDAPFRTTLHRSAPKRTADPGLNGRLSSGERKILTALAQYPSGRVKRQIAVLTGYAVGGGAFNNYLSALRTQGRIDGRDTIRITDEGERVLGRFDPLPSGRALQEYWLSQLGKAEREILQVLIDVHPRTLGKDEIASKTESGYAPSGGGFNNALSRLRTLELIDGHGQMRASDDLF